MQRASGRHVLTGDLEEYFQVEAFSRGGQRHDWESYPSRVEPSARTLLDLLDAAGATATFFVVGWLRQRHGALLREIADRGHEIACHSRWHRLVYELTPKEVEADALLAKAVRQPRPGLAVEGY